MKFVLYSDIHAQLAQLEAVQEAVDKENADKEIVAGDLVMLGVGPATGGSAPLAIVPRTPAAVPAAVEPSPASAATPTAPVWPFIVLGVWALGTLIAGTRLLLSVRTLRRRLAEREEVIVDPVRRSILMLRVEELPWAPPEYS